MSNIVLIPARSGSKRIKNKNIIEFEGMPIIGHAIKLARETELFDDVIVSTDDEVIRNISLKFGASVPWTRPQHLADDFATTLDVMKHSAEEIIKIHPQTKNICCLYPATPLLDHEIIKKAYELFILSDANFTFPSIEHPIYRTFTLGEKKEVVLNFPEHSQTRTQDLKKTYIDSGQFYWGKLDAWLEGSEIFGPHSNSLVIPRYSVVDIDSMEDFELAESLFKLKKGTKNE
jgi:pseudaminic acid cytidylyltransferase